MDKIDFLAEVLSIKIILLAGLKQESLTIAKAKAGQLSIKIILLAGLKLNLE